MSKQYFVLFAGDHPNEPYGQAMFVELEDEHGKSVRGEWIKWASGWKLAIPIADDD